MIATDEGFQSIQTHIDVMKTTNLEESTPLTLFGELLIEMGKFSKAEMYHRDLIENLPKDHYDLPFLYHGLGYNYYKQQRYKEALEYGYRGHRLLKDRPSSKAVHIAQSLLNLGWDHKKDDDPQKAMQLFRKALEIRTKAYDGKDHINIALTLSAIGDTYTDLNDGKNAASNLFQAIEMFQRVLPPEHVEICKGWIRIGHFYQREGLAEQAINYYRRGYEMAKRTMPNDHPYLMEYAENVERVIAMTK